MEYSNAVTQAIINMLNQVGEYCIDLLEVCLPILAPVIAIFFGIYFAFKLIPLALGVGETSVVGSLIPEMEEEELIDTETGEIINWEELENAPVDNDIYWQYEDYEDEED